MEETLISFETAKLAKDKGFTMFKKSFKSAIIDSRNYDVQRYSFYRVIKDEQILELNVGTNSSNINGLYESYNDENFVTQKNYFAPTQALLQRWLREVHEIEVNPNQNFTKGGIKMQYNISIESRKHNHLGKYVYGNTYEEVLEVGLQEALKLI